jgi:hypothetical protein
VFTTVRHWSLSWTSPVHRLTSYFFQTHFCISFTSAPGGLVPTRFLYIYTHTHTHTLHACYMPRIIHRPWFHHPNGIWWSVQAMKLLITQLFFQPSCHFLLLRSKHSPQHFDLIFLRSIFFSNREIKSRDSSVGIALGYGLEDRGSRFRFLAGAGNFSFHHRVQNGSGAHPASYPMGTRGSFPEGKAAGAWSWQLTSMKTYWGVEI